MSQPYIVRDDADGRVFDYTASLSAPAPTPRGDNISHSYAPPNHDTGRGWAFDDALEACVASTMLGAVLGIGAAYVAGHVIGVSLVGVLVALGSGFVLPFVWPFSFGWRNPYQAYRETRAAWQEVTMNYHDAAIERLRPATDNPTPTPVAPPAPVTPRIERPTPDAGEMFYLQCAAVLERATFDPRSPRKASEKIIRATKSGAPVVVTKDDYDDVAGMLCSLGFMVGGEGQKPRNYALAPAWQGKTVSELWAALKVHKATIKAKAA